MKFRGEDYHGASLERMRQARLLYGSGVDYALSMYCAGVAIECLLRAFRWEEDRSFSGRHDLNELLQASQILKIDEDAMRRRGATQAEVSEIGLRFRVAFQEIVRLWTNNIRYASDARLAVHLRPTGASRKSRGSILKAECLALVEAAQFVVDRGTVLWALRQRSPKH